MQNNLILQLIQLDRISLNLQKLESLILASLSRQIPDNHSHSNFSAYLQGREGMFSILQILR